MRRSTYLVKLGPTETGILPTIAKVVSNITYGEEKIKVSGVYRPGTGMMTYVYAKSGIFDYEEFKELKKRMRSNKKIGKRMTDKVINQNYQL